MKILTFSYDDGVKQDARLAELFLKYGMRATFNINSELLSLEGKLDWNGMTARHDKVDPADIKRIYQGHEVAAHTLRHPLLPAIEDEAEIIRQVEQDRLNLSELCGYEVVGFAYPCGGKNYDSRVSEIIKRNTGVRYARNIVSNFSFDPQENLHEFCPTVHHMNWDKMFELGEQFLNLKTDEKKIYYVWGHAYEFDFDNSWDRFEQFLKMMSGKEDILYLTNREALL